MLNSYNSSKFNGNIKISKISVLFFIILSLLFISNIYAYGVWHDLDWEKQNPYIIQMSDPQNELGYINAWNITHFNGIIDSAELSNITVLNTNSEAQIVMSKIHTFGNKLSALYETSTNCEFAQRELKETQDFINENTEYFENCTSIGSIVYNLVLASSPLTRGISDYNIATCVLSYYYKEKGEEKYNKLVSDMKECDKYGTEWKSDADLLVSILQYTELNSANERDHLNTCYNSLMNDYEINRIKDNTLQEKFNSFNYTYYNFDCNVHNTSLFCLWNKRVNQLEENINQIDPSFSGFFTVIIEYWSKNSTGIWNSLNKANEECTNIKSYADSLLITSKSSAKAELSNLHNCITDLYNQHVELFSGNFSVSAIIAGNSQIANLNSNLNSMAQNYDTMANNYNLFLNSPYTSKGIKINQFLNISTTSQNDLHKCQNMKTMARQTVELMKQQLINYSSNLHEEDKKYILTTINNAESKTLGEKYQTYIRLYNYYNSVIKNPLWHYNLTTLSNLLDNAEKDNIDVSYQKYMFNDLKSHWDSKLYTSIRQAVFEKANAKYYYLPSKRTNLIADLKKAGAIDLIEEMNLYEHSLGLDFSGGFNIDTSIGHLRDLDKKYSDLRNQLTDTEKSRIKNSKVKVYEDVFVSPAKLGQESNITLVLYAYNYYDYPLVNASYTSNLDFTDISLDQNSKGLADLIPSPKNMLMLKFKRIARYSNVRVSLSGKYTSTKIMKQDSSSYADIYNLGYVSNKYVFTAYKNTPVFVDSSCVVDGWIKPTNGVVSIQKGNHAMICKKTLNPAYIVNLTISNQTKNTFGQSICYSAKIQFNGDFSTANILISGIKGSKLTYNPDSHISSVKQGVDGVVLSLKHLSAITPTVVKFCISISNLSEYLYEKIEYYSALESNSELDTKAIAYLNKAKMYYNQDKYASALNQINSLETYYVSYVKNIKFEMANVNTTLSQIAKEKSKISNIITNASKLNDTYLNNMLSSRLSDIRNLDVWIRDKLKSGDVSGAYKLSKKYDPYWFSSVILDYYNHLKDKYTDITDNLGNNGLPLDSYNLSTSADEVSAKLNDFLVNPTLDSALDAESSLMSFKSKSDILISKKSKIRDNLTSKIKSISEHINQLYDIYNREYSYNPGYFKYNPKYVKSKIKLTGLDKYPIVGLNRTYASLEDVYNSIKSGLNSLKKTSVASYSHLFSLYSNMSDKDPNKSKLKDKLKTIGGYINTQKYGVALQSIKKTMDDLKNSGTVENTGPTLISIIGLFVLGGVIGYAYYIYSKKKGRSAPPRRLSKE